MSNAHILITVVLAAYGLLNLAALAAYGVDKQAARRGTWRTREATLLSLSIFGGAFGGLLAMFLFRHKTRKLLFWAANLLAAGGHAWLLGQLLR